MSTIREFHLFTGIGGGIYGGQILGHACVGGVEIDEYCTQVLLQKQKDGWMEKFPIYNDIRKLNGENYQGTFDILCGGFPCQAFSHAARGKNIPEKNLWPDMLRFTLESIAPIVFAENVTLKAIKTASIDLKRIGYTVQNCKLSCGDLGADHRRDRYWLLAIKDNNKLENIIERFSVLPKMHMNCWSNSIDQMGETVEVTNRRTQLKAVGNAQSPLVAACAFRVLANRLLINHEFPTKVAPEELSEIYVYQPTWIKRNYGEEFGYVHTPTTMANYSAPSMMKHLGCRNFVEVFGRPTPSNAEYLMGMPQGASTTDPLGMDNYNIWMNSIYK